MREVREGVRYLRHVVDEQGPLVVVMSDPDPCPFHSHSTMTVESGVEQRLRSRDEVRQ